MFATYFHPKNYRILGKAAQKYGAQRLSALVPVFDRKLAIIPRVGTKRYHLNVSSPTTILSEDEMDVISSLSRI